ncbi:MAG: YggS family pyridoxal phosphate-dependent enzyme, partial [Bacteroidota bacterium]
MLQQILTQLKASNTTLVAVSKTKPNEAIMAIYEQGHNIFGENRVQEMVGKYEALPKDIQWHLIGHLQTNKVKYMAAFVAMIHSVDSLKLLKEINKQAQKHERVIPCLLQFHIAEESSKFGLDLTDAKALLESDAFRQMQNVQIAGVMGMATFTDDEQQVRREFGQLKQIFDRLKSDYFSDSEHFREISMGMSGDYLLAVEEGSTLVRIGSLLFGAR